MRQSQRRAGGSVTIKDIAAAAGVSATTVSNVLNGRTDAMAQDTLERIQAVMTDLHYRPNRLARSMVTRRSQTIGLVLIEVDTPLFLRALNVVEPIARAAGYNLLLCSAKDPPEENVALEVLLEKQVEGVVFISTSQRMSDEHIARLQSRGMPVVLVNRTTTRDEFDGAYWDNVAGTVEIVRHLYELGHRRIGFLTGPPDRRSTDERLRGYFAGLRECGLPRDEALIGRGDYTGDPALWQAATTALLSLPKRATAIIASDDAVAASVMRTIRHFGLCVPDDVSVVGVDDQPFCAYLDPMLTTMRLPVLEASEAGIRMLLERIAGQSEATRKVLLPCGLVIRESTGPAPSVPERVVPHSPLREETIRC